MLMARLGTSHVHLGYGLQSKSGGADSSFIVRSPALNQPLVDVNHPYKTPFFWGVVHLKTIPGSLVVLQPAWLVRLG